ncbi:MAG: sulfurtransferase [Gammaproteobacteria bacterium]|jgi:adenylyltransferase/sulfurtransferase|nr:sulfurtransferase [Gammaproteobacteria bacterium]
MVTDITPIEFVTRRDAGEDMVLLDVREPHEVEAASVPGILHIPMAQVPHRLAELDPSREIVVMCKAGGRSMQVARFLESRGYTRVLNLTGGILRWTQDVDPSLTPI